MRSNRRSIPLARRGVTTRTRIAVAAALATFLTLLASCGGGVAVDAGSPATPTGSVPDDAPIRSQHVAYATAPPGYSHVLAWAQATTLAASASGQPAGVEIDYMRLLEENPMTGARKTLVELNFNVDRPSCDGNGCEGGNFVRRPWYGNGGASVPMSNSALSGGSLRIDLARAPDRVAHWWTPRAAAAPGARYLVEARYRVIGAAALQFGSDWWRGANSPYAGYDATCQRSNNCEAWLGHWVGDTGGEFVTKTFPAY